MKDQTRLTLGDFHSDDISLHEYISQFTYPIEIVLFEGEFVIGKALQITAEKITSDDEIIYFCDADAVLPDCIFQRIRKHTIRNKQIYAPIVSKESNQGNGRLVKIIPRDYKRKGHIGVFRSDFAKCSGWRTGKHLHKPGLESNPMERTKWGLHDGHIFAVLTEELGLKAIRPQETDQWLRWHPPKLGWGDKE